VLGKRVGIGELSGDREAAALLKDAFGASNMPLLKTKLIGSAGRHTSSPP